VRRVLVEETASPKRVRRDVEKILQAPSGAEQAVSVLCTGDPCTVDYFRSIGNVEVIPLPDTRRRALRQVLAGRQFDVVRAFWTGEKKYRRMKVLALTVPAAVREVDSGDGGSFLLTWRSVLRYWLFRLRHPLPSDHQEFVPAPATPDMVPYYRGERILLLQSAEPPYLLRAARRMRQESLFVNPRFTVFCRNRPEIVRQFDNPSLIEEVRTHSETRGALRHLRELRREHYDGVVVFFTGDPSYWKIKYLAFLLGARHKVVFNENNDCFFFSWRRWLALVTHRLGSRSRPDIDIRWPPQVRTWLWLTLKGVLFPFRFAWLLLVWIRLRLAAG